MENKPKQICIHKSGYGFQDAEGIKKYHLSKGWRDIGYHYVIQKDGTLQEGRPVGMKPAHASGHNDDVIAICVIGEFCKDEPSEAQINQLKFLILNLCKEHHIDTSMHQIFCHADYRDKPGNRFCPGKYLHRQIPSIANWVRQMIQKGA